MKLSNIKDKSCEQVVPETLQKISKANNASKPYATLFALVKLFTKNQDQFCIQVGYQTFQHYFQSK